MGTAAYTQAIEGAYGKSWKISSKMGWRIHPIHKTKKHHNGTDIISLGRHPVYVQAIANGRVVKTRKSNAAGGGFGYYVVIRHYIDGQFYTSLYAHLAANTFQVKPGQKVAAGDIIGKMGSTGMSTGRHLHLEVWKGRTHGWSSDGSGFIEPVGFIKALSAAQESKASAKVATHPKAKVQPIAVHEKAGAKITYNAVKPAVLAKERAVVKLKAAMPIVATPKKVVAKKVVDKPKARVYTVKSGDTLGKIARANKTTASALQKINGIKNANVISIGQKIKLS
jgi:murein DD-endopeptidase MepM/ murein hydrolase activator NlpD